MVFSFLWVQLHCQWHVLFALLIVNVHIHCPPQVHVNHRTTLVAKDMICFNLQATGLLFKLLHMVYAVILF